MFQFSQQIYNVGEGDGIAEVCIDLTGGVTSVDTDVTISTSDGTANGNRYSCTHSYDCFNVWFYRMLCIYIHTYMFSEPDDYTSTTQIVTFPAGAPPPGRLCIDIPIINDLDVEGLESFAVSASTTDPRAVFPQGGDTASVFIADNDGRTAASLSVEKAFIYMICLFLQRPCLSLFRILSAGLRASPHLQTFHFQFD